MSEEGDDLGGLSMLELFRLEAEVQLQSLNEHLLKLESDPEDKTSLEACMRATHSLKGASRMVDLNAAVEINHSLEDLFVAAQHNQLTITPEIVDSCFGCIDVLSKLAQCTSDKLEMWLNEHQATIDQKIQNLHQWTNPGRQDSEHTGNDSGADNLQENSDHYPGFSTDPTMLELFRMEVQTHGKDLQDGLPALSSSAPSPALLRAANALKGASRLVDIVAAAELSLAIEQCLLSAKESGNPLKKSALEHLMRANQLILEIGCLDIPESASWMKQHSEEIHSLIDLVDPAGNEATDSMEKPQEIADNPQTVSLQAALPEISTAAFTADATMLGLFRDEVENHGNNLSQQLLQLEENPTDAKILEAMMRASHSIKGAARMVGVDCAVQIAHVMEDVFVAAQAAKLKLETGHVDILLQGVDMLERIAAVEAADSASWLAQNAPDMGMLLLNLQQVLKGEPPIMGTADNASQQEEKTPAKTGSTVEVETNPGVTPQPVAQKSASRAAATKQETAIRVSSESLNRLMGLAGEVRVESRWLRPFADGLVQVKHRQTELISILDRLGEAINHLKADEYTCSLLSEAQHKASQCRHSLADRMNDLEDYDRRSHNLADRLNREVVASRMRPFGDGIPGFQRMVRDLSRSLGKQVKLEIIGLSTQVDRDILNKMEAPLNHLVRNALDHGIETPQERLAAGKPEQATITLEAVHSAGMLSIIIRDDGRGIDPEVLRRKVVDKNLTNEAMAATLSEAELMEFMFLPGFSTRDQVTELSGRGVGLDVVHSTIQEMRGMVRATSKPGKGMQFHMQLPLTLSVVRALLVEISGEPYAFPLARIDRTMKMHRDHIETMEGRQYFTLGNQHIGILTASQVLELLVPPLQQDELHIVVLGERMNRYGLVVDRFLGERNLVVQTLDSRLGKVQDVSSAAILENGAPCLIMDVDDLIRSIDILIAGGRLNQVDKKGDTGVSHRGKRVLVVDDSITVREVERNMLTSRGYAVDVAVDGMDGWNAVRTGHYDLVISDVDMPRMNGFEFVEHIKGDANLKSTPVMIVSYKDREEDRARGLEVGADYYLTKGSFHDETLLDAVVDLIGEA